MNSTKHAFACLLACSSAVGPKLAPETNIMKSISVVILASGMFLLPQLLKAQSAGFGYANRGVMPVQPVAPDSIVIITAEAQGLQTVAYQDLPLFGTYWEVMPVGMAPLPCPPSDPTLPIYAITDNIFLVDATYGQVVVNPRRTAMMSSSSAVTFTLEALATSVVDLINQVQEAELNRESNALFTLDGGNRPLITDGGMSFTNGLNIHIFEAKPQSYIP
jgi:hypothetical protein